MRKEYDFSNAKKNPYVKVIKTEEQQVTMNMKKVLIFVLSIVFILCINTQVFAAEKSDINKSSQINLKPILKTNTKNTSDAKNETKEYILPNSSKRELTTKELEKLTKEELKLARNEIYARHGRMFKSEELQEYFNAKSWYKGTIKPGDFKEDVLSEIEKRNVDLIIEAEKKAEDVIETGVYQIDGSTCFEGKPADYLKTYFTKVELKGNTVIIEGHYEKGDVNPGFLICKNGKAIDGKTVLKINKDSKFIYSGGDEPSMETKDVKRFFDDVNRSHELSLVFIIEDDIIKSVTASI